MRTTSAVGIGALAGAVGARAIVRADRERIASRVNDGIAADDEYLTRYGSLPVAERRPVQAAIGRDGRLHTVGIPNEGDLARLRGAARVRGFAVDGLSG